FCEPRYLHSFPTRRSSDLCFALFDSRDNSYLVARDHMGIIPLYYGFDPFGQYFVASELKALEGFCERIEQFPPGHYLYSKEGDADRKSTRLNSSHVKISYA